MNISFCLFQIPTHFFLRFFISHAILLYTPEPCHEKTCLREVWDQVRLKPACSAAEASQSIDSSYTATTCIIISKEQTAKVLIRLSDLHLCCLQLVHGEAHMYMHKSTAIN